MQGGTPGADGVQAHHLYKNQIERGQQADQCSDKLRDVYIALCRREGREAQGDNGKRGTHQPQARPGTVIGTDVPGTTE